MLKYYVTRFDETLILFYIKNYYRKGLKKAEKTGTKNKTYSKIIKIIKTKR